MRIALIADLHGNLPATLAVADDIRRRGADAIWCLGDIVGKGPSSAETFDWAMDSCDLILRGNWDEGIALTVKNSVKLALESWQQKNWAQLYRLIQQS